MNKLKSYEKPQANIMIFEESEILTESPYSNWDIQTPSGDTDSSGSIGYVGDDDTPVGD